MARPGSSRTIGLETAPDLASLWETIAEFGESPEHLEGLASLAEGFDDPLSAVETLRALGVDAVDSYSATCGSD